MSNEKAFMPAGVTGNVGDGETVEKKLHLNYIFKFLWNVVSSFD